MLTPSDLKAIGEVIKQEVPPIVGRVIEDKVPRMIEEKIKVALDAVDGLEARMDVKFEAVHERLNEIENKMVTKSDMESYEVRLTERYDKRYVRLNPAS